MIVFKKFKLVPYVAELWIFVSDDPSKDIQKYNKKHPGLDLTWDLDSAACTSNHYYKDKVIWVILDSKWNDLNTVVHEAVHVVNRLFTYAGVRPDLENDEH